MSKGKKVFKNILSLIALYFIVFIISIGINIAIDLRSKESSEVSENVFYGLGLFVSNKDNDIHNSVMDYLNMSDYKFTLMNRTDEALDCNINAFINGKQINLINTQTGEKEYNFKMFIDNNEDRNIPIELDLEGLNIGSYIVNISIESNYDENAIDKDEDVWITSNYNYILGIENQSPELNIAKHEDIQILESNFAYEEINQFIVNFTKDQFLDNKIPHKYMEVKADEEIEIPIILGGGDISSSLIYATVDNNQVKLNNSDFLRFSFSENMLQETNIKIKSPEKAGKYELLIYALNNYEDKNINEYDDIKLSTSHRITLVVK